MTKWLASVKSLDEAKQLADVLPDILDIKNPSQGALGALPVAEVAAIVTWLQQRCLSSATIGDLPMVPAIIAQHLQAMSESGVAVLKVGLFADKQLMTCLEALTPTIKALPQPVIGVIFADAMPDDGIIAQLAAAGFQGVMVDTAFKNGKGLRDHWTLGQIRQFVDTVKSRQMLCGLAGALRYDDIAVLKPLNADYLGFRSALCQQQARQKGLDKEAIQRLAQAMRA